MQKTNSLNLPSQIDATVVISPDEKLTIYGNHQVDKTRYKWASVTKLLAMYVIADAIATGFLSLEEQVDSSIFHGNHVTIADLLSHSSGIRSAGQEVIEPRIKRIYSNLSFEVAEEHLIKKLGEGFEKETIGTLFNDGFSTQLKSSIRIEGSCASGATGTLDDLIIFLNEIRNPKFIDPALNSKFTSIHNDGLPGVLPGWGYMQNNSWGIGYEIKGNKSSHWMGAIASSGSYGHFGMSGTFVFHDPINKISIGVLSNQDFGPWAKDVWPQLCESMYKSHM